MVTMPENCAHTAVIACGNLKPELDALCKDCRGLDLQFMDPDLHRTPDRMTGILQEAVNRAARPGIGKIVLGYGLCSNGIVGLRAPAQGLIVPPGTRLHCPVSRVPRGIPSSAP